MNGRVEPGRGNAQISFFANVDDNKWNVVAYVELRVTVQAVLVADDWSYLNVNVNVISRTALIRNRVSRRVLIGLILSHDQTGKNRRKMYNS